ncbi:probable G-protein coupled receptor Mth-like 6 [Neodiprion pinetum]|uniref:probable G-protein coupled receptor Mth-like 6 n=1 Tax=Neodiprion pinetum TaxID=441929 RepID=UPI001EE10BD4|nr:probable G-protein coupled receptor Mth-like 6 [Neodiprion pinetum]XP_046469806.1 probable G-protein coupled receptor Mth-like 6 [Neodiprion pinetum]XP_046469807.1 probable G-protein coupled receptor Mth-like 6 [Neodiprion pinetum]XP_046469808.1 probable G-protein coupled receptor Mth-like 6 [Neodiprion pinetum]XP_046469809.1 probable G-protein coupled receptor Mth-like 6 [Neodiprion pinetum]
MIGGRVFLAVIYAMAFVSGRAEVDGFRESCPSNAIVNLSRRKSMSPGLTKDSSDINLPNATRPEDRITVGCLCDFKTCLKLCCPLEKAWYEQSCVEDDTVYIFPEIKTLIDDGQKNLTLQDFHIVPDYPCGFGWATLDVLENFYAFPNGSIYTPDFYGSKSHGFDNYCLLRNPNSSVYLAVVCYPKASMNYWDTICWSIQFIIILAVFVCYTIVPELRTFHGMIVRSYIAAYVGLYLGALGIMITNGLRDYVQLNILSEIVVQYCDIASVLWLNVMSVNIWRTFRSVKSADSNVDQRNQKKFVLCMIYAWGTPAVIVLSSVAVMRYVPYFHNEIFGLTFTWWTSLTFSSVVYMCNTLLYIVTVITIKRQKKDTALLTIDVNKHHETTNQWCRTYVKLLTIMTGHMGGFTVVWAVCIIWPTPALIHSFTTLGMVQSVFIFALFLWQDHMKRAISKQLCIRVQRLRNFFVRSKPRITTDCES